MEDKAHKELIKNFSKSAVKQAPKGKFKLCVITCTLND